MRGSVDCLLLQLADEAVDGDVWVMSEDRTAQLSTSAASCSGGQLDARDIGRYCQRFISYALVRSQLTELA